MTKQGDGLSVRPRWRPLTHSDERPKHITYPAAVWFVLGAIPTGLLVENVLPPPAGPLVFLAAVLAAAVFGGVGEALFAAVLSYLAYAWFFGEPRHSLSIYDSGEVAAVVYFLAAAVVVGALGARLRGQLSRSRESAERARTLYQLSRRVSGALSEREVNDTIVDFVARAMESPAALLHVRPGGEVVVAAAEPPLARVGDDVRAAAEWAWRRRESAGWSTGRFPELDWLLFPVTAGAPPALLAIARRNDVAGLTASEWQLVATLADQARVVVERARLVRENAEAQRYRETERLRSALLSSVSHDLRTPLASIVGAATTLQSLGDRLTPENRTALAETIAGESRRLNRYIQNLLDMTRLDHGALRAEAEWIDLRDVAAAARGRVRDALAGRRVLQTIPEDSAFAHADPTLLEQILVNILDNAGKFGRADGEVSIDASARDDVIVLSVTDDGPGVPPAERERIFEPFHSAEAGDRGRAGAGLGLSIARGFARAMGGDVVVREALAGRGARFEVILRRIAEPALELDEGAAPAPEVSNDAA